MAETSGRMGKQHTDDTEPETTVQPGDEPVFDEPVFDESVYPAEADEAEPAFATADDFGEPVFEAEDAGADPERDVHEVAAIGASTRSTAMESQTAGRSNVGRFPVDNSHAGDDSEDDLDPVSVIRRQDRRLGRTGPFWMIAAGVTVVLLFAIWFGFFRSRDDLAEQQLAPVTTGQAGSVAMPGEAGAAEPAEEPTSQSIPTDTPIPLLTVGQQVVVSNTDGAGIRLRNEPGLGAVTLAIYDEGDAFTVLNPDGDYTEYPVEADGYRWYRIQIAGNPDENLSGWAVGDFLSATE